MKEICLFEPIDYDSCTGENLANKVLIIRPEYLDVDYREAKWQLFFAQGGFGCDPEASGRKVFGRYVGDGAETAINRDNFLGIATNRAIACYIEKYGKLSPDMEGYLEAAGYSL